MTETVPAEDWLARATAHYERVAPWTKAWRERKAARCPHPVFDFLFTYYSYSPAKLERWSPGWQSVLDDPDKRAEEFLTPKYALVSAMENTFSYPPERIPEKVRKRLRWIVDLLESTAARPGQFGCFGLHEWAMVYHGNEVRHEKSAGLRLPKHEVDAIVESRPLCCTHYDAFRFFSPDARPMNRFEPDYEGRQKNEQPGCIHTNMDLYKWAYKSMPWIGSDLLWQCFEFALACREIDMRASPYDLSSYGYTPIKIETTDGRREYEAAQRELARRAAPLRKTLIEELSALLEARESALLQHQKPQTVQAD